MAPQLRRHEVLLSQEDAEFNKHMTPDEA
jgi:hypothetical protein